MQEVKGTVGPVPAGYCCHTRAPAAGRGGPAGAPVPLPDSSPGDPKRPSQGQASSLQIAVLPRRPAALEGNPKQHRGTVEKNLCIYNVAHSDHFSISCVEEPWPGNLNVTLRSTQLAQTAIRARRQTGRDLYASGLPLKSQEGPAPSLVPESAKKGRWRAEGPGNKSQAEEKPLGQVGRRSQVFIKSVFGGKTLWIQEEIRT